MADQIPPSDLPGAKSPTLQLANPTPEECIKIWSTTFESWGDSLTLPVYLTESKYLTTVPLAKDGGMTIWILTEKDRPPNDRPILASCESFFKNSLVNDPTGGSSSSSSVRDVTIHGIASVYCAIPYRRRGYAARLLKELIHKLFHWRQNDGQEVVGSVLYSDIGKKYYADMGWIPNATNAHVVFESKRMNSWAPGVRAVREGDIAELCRRDEGVIREAMAARAEGEARRVTILPDLDHMLWHMGKEAFAAEYLFGEVPAAKGAIAGLPGKQVWVIWTHRYYGRHDAESTENVLYILRLVIEGDKSANGAGLIQSNGATDLQDDEQAGYLKAVLQAAQDEAAQWKLDYIKLWEPSPWAESMIKKSGISHSIVERDYDSVASGYWYDSEGKLSSVPVWVNNEHFAWC